MFKFSVVQAVVLGHVRLLEHALSNGLLLFLRQTAVCRGRGQIAIVVYSLVALYFHCRALQVGCPGNR